MVWCGDVGWRNKSRKTPVGREGELRRSGEVGGVGSFCAGVVGGEDRDGAAEEGERGRHAAWPAGERHNPRERKGWGGTAT